MRRRENVPWEVGSKVRASTVPQESRLSVATTLERPKNLIVSELTWAYSAARYKRVLWAGDPVRYGANDGVGGEAGWLGDEQ